MIRLIWWRFEAERLKCAKIQYHYFQTWKKKKVIKRLSLAAPEHFFWRKNCSVSPQDKLRTSFYGPLFRQEIAFKMFQKCLKEYQYFDTAVKMLWIFIWFSFWIFFIFIFSWRIGAKAWKRITKGLEKEFISIRQNLKW